MEVINMKVVVSNLLKGMSSLKKVHTDYPKNWNTFPSAIYRTTKTPHFTDANGDELQSYWTITIELYGDSRTGSLTKITEELKEQMKTIGFIGDAKDANTAELTRVICVFSAVVDNVTKQVYQK